MFVNVFMSCVVLRILYPLICYIPTDSEGVKVQAELARIGMLSKSTVNAGHCEITNDIFSPTKNN